MYVKTDSPGFVKDPGSGAIINTNDADYKRILAMRAEIKKNKDICDKMNALENELTEIKNLLIQVVNGRN